MTARRDDRYGRDRGRPHIDAVMAVEDPPGHQRAPVQGEDRYMVRSRVPARWRLAQCRRLSLPHGPGCLRPGGYREGKPIPRPDVIGDLSGCRRWRGSHAIINDHRPPAQLVVVGRVVERPPAVPLGDRYRTATLVLPAPGSPALPVLPIPGDSLTGAVPRRPARRRQGEGTAPPFARAVASGPVLGEYPRRGRRRRCSHPGGAVRRPRPAVRVRAWGGLRQPPRQVRCMASRLR